MSFSPRFCISDFNTTSDPEQAGKYLRVLLDALFGIDILYLKSHPRTPFLYSSGIVYRRDESGKEDWQSIPELLKRGEGDCKSLACYLAAELYVTQGIKAFPQYRWRDRSAGGATYHIVVQMPNGAILDPSKRLGMQSKD